MLQPRLLTHYLSMTSLAAGYPWAEYMQEFGAHLRQVRTDAGMTQERVAHGAGIALFTYQKLEKGESNPGTPANPRLQTLLALSVVLGVEVGKLVPDPTRWQGIV